MENERALVKTKSAQPAQTTLPAKSAINPQAIFQKQGLAGLEKIIQTSIQKTQKHLIRLSLCLKYIRDNKLYLPYYPDFETYFQEKFNLSKAQCLVFLQTAFVYERLLEAGTQEDLLPELRLAAIFYDTSRALVPAVPTDYFEKYLSGLVRFIWALTLTTLPENKNKKITRIPPTHQTAVLKAVAEFFRLSPPEFIEISDTKEDGENSSGQVIALTETEQKVAQTEQKVAQTEQKVAQTEQKVAENAVQLSGITVFLTPLQRRRLTETIKQIKTEKTKTPIKNRKNHRRALVPVVNGDASLLAVFCKHHDLEVKICRIQISQQNCYFNLSCGCRLLAPTKVGSGFAPALKTVSKRLPAGELNETF